MYSDLRHHDLLEMRQVLPADLLHRDPPFVHYSLSPVLLRSFHSIFNSCSRRCPSTVSIDKLHDAVRVLISDIHMNGCTCSPADEMEGSKQCF